ncbi:MAG: prepilin-type N-terminal cleavage/methylation domain-containing protein [Syntrophales bacterium]|jgi:prepilin-type N-terminal cleavage/methylation domain-containing protein
MKTIKIKFVTEKRGFTLIELVSAIVVVAILSAFTGMGFVYMVHGYVLAKKNADTVQNAEIILARLAKELKSTTSITSGNQTSLTFLSKSTNPVDQSLFLSWNNAQNILSLGPTGNADTLAYNVSSFSLSYFNKFDDTAGPTYLPASTMIIKITLSLTGADNVISTFEERVFLYSLISGI